jgi:hypothetical protein
MNVKGTGPSGEVRMVEVPGFPGHPRSVAGRKSPETWATRQIAAVVVTIGLVS